MSAFNLPDLGEGLQDAEILEWVITEGDTVEVDQLVIVVETAKAVVELPSPVNSIITKCCVKVGDTVDVGQALFEYVSEEAVIAKGQVSKAASVEQSKSSSESVSVVGVLPNSNDKNDDQYENFSFSSVDEVNQYQPEVKKRRSNDKMLAPPNVLALAQKLGLQDVLLDNEYGCLSQKDLVAIYTKNHTKMTDENTSETKNKIIKLSGARKVMAQSMTKSHQHIPSVTLFDDANIQHWEKGTDITLKLIESIIEATRQVPLLNAWFDEENLSVQLFDDVNLGVAVNAKDGLFVPVIRKVQSMQNEMIREVLDEMIDGVNHRTIKAQKLLGATISLSNFGTLSGRYATPIIVPPQVAIVGIGKIKQQPVVKKGALVVGRVMPISLSFDHRAASGADASAFMQAMIECLEK